MIHLEGDTNCIPHRIFERLKARIEKVVQGHVDRCEPIRYDEPTVHEFAALVRNFFRSQCEAQELEEDLLVKVIKSTPADIESRQIRFRVISPFLEKQRGEKLKTMRQFFDDEGMDWDEKAERLIKRCIAGNFTVESMKDLLK